MAEHKNSVPRKYWAAYKADLEKGEPGIVALEKKRDALEQKQFSAAVIAYFNSKAKPSGEEAEKAEVRKMYKGEETNGLFDDFFNDVVLPEPKKEEELEPKEEQNLNNEEVEEVKPINESIILDNYKDMPISIAGVKRGKPMTHKEADNGSVNPLYWYKKTYSTNCQTCCVVYELRRRGYDIEAQNKKKKTDKYFGIYSFSTYKVGEKYFVTTSLFDVKQEDIFYSQGRDSEEIAQEMKENIQPNARYILSVNREDKGAHNMMCFKNEEEKITIYDPQDNATYVEDSPLFLKLLSYVKKGQKEKALNAYWYRVDNVALKKHYNFQNMEEMLQKYEIYFDFYPKKKDKVEKGWDTLEALNLITKPSNSRR